MGKRRYCGGGVAARLKFYSERQPNGCLLWTGTVNRRGYGTMTVDYKTVTVHRQAYVEAYGPVPPGKQVCHTCDTPLCIEEDHLWAGTALENHLDKIAKGRDRPPHSEAHPYAKLDCGKARAIFVDRRRAEVIAAEYEIGLSQVYRIWTRYAWRRATEGLTR